MYAVICYGLRRGLHADMNGHDAAAEIAVAYGRKPGFHKKRPEGLLIREGPYRGREIVVDPSLITGDESADGWEQ